VGRHALALQFHAEFEAARLEEWLSGHAVELAHARVDLQRLRADCERHGATLASAASDLLTRWLAAIGQPAPTENIELAPNEHFPAPRL
jgi:GMP synthase (glutamine-hydrolysing)